MLIVHIAGGLLILLPAAAFVAWHLRRALRARNRAAEATGVALAGLGLVLAASGLVVLTEANSRDLRFVFRTHQVGAALLVAVWIAHRLVARNRPARGRIALGAAAVLLLYGLLAGGLAATTEAGAPARTRTAGAESPFLPGRATTASGGRADPAFLTGGDRGGRVGAGACVRCHADIVAQWAESAHRFSSLNNPFYLAPVEELRERHGAARSRWCASCHDPALLLPGRMSAELDRGAPESLAGLTCLACHAIEGTRNVTGNGNYRIADDAPEPYLLAGRRTGAAAFVHDRLVKAKPEAHRRRMLKPIHRTAEFCAACHKVSLTRDVNDYRFLRGQDEYDAHHDSGVSRNSPRTFYLPAEARTCQDCHMPREPVRFGDVAAKDGTVRSHRFHAANTALPAVRGDAGALRRVTESLADRRLRVDLFSLSRSGREPTMPLDRARPALLPGETVTFEVVVRNLSVGHAFPGGTNDGNEGWIDFSVTGPRGEEICRSGAVGPDRRVDPGAHFYRAVFVDREGKRANRRNPTDFRSLVYAKVIGPGTADLVRYEVRLPPDLSAGEVRVRAALRWRKFNREYTEYVFRRLGRPVPDLPITEVAAASVSLPVRAEEGPPPASRALAEDWMRWNDRGIALLLQGDTRGAAASFRGVVEAAPERVDGYRNLARTALRDGDLDAALRWLRKAREVAPDDPQHAWFFGRALRAAGEYDLAEEAFRESVAAFPEDRGSWRELGKVRFLSGRFESALAAFRRVLRIDPEDADALHHVMKCYRGLGREEEAEEARSAWLRVKVDDNAPKVARRYLLEHEDMNREAQPIHVHR